MEEKEYRNNKEQEAQPKEIVDDDSFDALNDELAGWLEDYFGAFLSNQVETKKKSDPWERVELWCKDLDKYREELKREMRRFQRKKLPDLGGRSTRIFVELRRILVLLTMLADTNAEALFELKKLIKERG